MDKQFLERGLIMFKSLFKSLILGATSGLGCAAGGWAWKNCMEEKANEIKQDRDKKKKSSSETEENWYTNKT